MSKAGGLILILGGLAVAAFAMPSNNARAGRIREGDRRGQERAGRTSVLS